MSATIVQKAKRILEGLEYGAFITSKEWETENFDDYFNHFSDPNPDVRKYSLLVFAAGLGNWYSKSAFIFRPLKELRKDPFYDDPNAVYYFPHYIEAFMKNRENIKLDYPELYRMIVLLLIKLDNEESFDIMFPEHIQLFKQLRNFLTDSGIKDSLIYDGFQKFLYDLNLPNFYKK